MNSIKFTSMNIFGKKEDKNMCIKKVNIYNFQQKKFISILYSFKIHVLLRSICTEIQPM